MKEIKTFLKNIPDKIIEKKILRIFKMTVILFMIITLNVSGSPDQPVRVSGTITDENGSAFPGVNHQRY
jgi:hypothetical protein